MEASRPDPDQLLARIRSDAGREAMGSLKVFFGAAAGVGKTYAMLQAAHEARRAGRDVVVGYVETHGRPETEALLQGLEILPRRIVHYRGAALSEFDLDAALARRPQLLLVDEAAHTNAPGSRHEKRWQDLQELLGVGVDVWTTLNVQHLESLNDLVAQVTGVTVRETLPDSMLDEAGEIELVDLPPAELLARLRDGKVYLPEQAGRAAEGFFREGNLIALREMALRRTADRVDAQMRDYRRSHSIEQTWPVKERLMVGVGPSPFATQLIRSTARLAAQLEAEWMAVSVELPGYASLPESTRARVLRNLRLAEQLGGQTATVNGTDAGESLIRFALANNVSKIVVGKTAEPAWRRMLHGSLADRLMRDSGGIEIFVIPAREEMPSGTPAPKAPAQPLQWRTFVLPTLMVAACTAAALLLRGRAAVANLVMVYLLGVVLVAMRGTRAQAFFACLFSVAAFDFFCVPPYLTFAVADYEFLFTFGVMLTVALVISGLTLRIRAQAEQAAARDARTQSLYRFVRALAGQSGLFEIAQTAARLAGQTFGVPVMILLADEGRVTFQRRTSDRPIAPPAEEAVAQWVFDNNQRAGAGSSTLSGSKALYLPLKGSARMQGVMAAIPSAQVSSSPEQMNLLELYAMQTAQALESAAAAQTARDAELRMRTEEMRASLLSAVSHDLRTPLASITGAATTLIDQGGRLPEGTRRELLDSIADEADRLGRLVANLLEMTRLEAGVVEPRREWHSLEEIVGAALNRLARLLARHPVATDLPADLPLVQVDDVLIGQVFVNLLENCARYTPAGTSVEIAARMEGREVVVEVRDHGPGFRPDEVNRVFEKFYRGRRDGVRGAGLGLAIAQAIVQAHGGSIGAQNHPGGGAAIRFTVPAGEAAAV